MWQILWMVSLIPAGVLNWIVNLTLIAGVVGLCASWIGKWIPWFSMYARLLKPIGILLLCLGLFLKGGYATEMAWRAKIEALEAKVAESEQKSKDANFELEKVLKDKKKVVKDTQVIIQTRIKEVQKVIDSECKIKPEVISILNDAAKPIK